MASVLETPPEIESTRTLPTLARNRDNVPVERAVDYSVHSTLSELPGYAVILDSSTTGHDLGVLLASQTSLPGVILLEKGELLGVISQSHYYKCVSRAFGREIYQGRSATLMLDHGKDQVLILMADCPIQEAVVQCLSRAPSLVYEPFLVYHHATGNYRLCSFQALLLASSSIASLRNRQMEQILNSITEGLLVIDHTFQIGPEYSRAAAHLFERTDLSDFTLLEVLAPLIDPVLHEQIAEYLKVLFNPKLIDKLIKTINPAKQITLRFPLPEEHVRHFTFNFERVRAGAEISQVLVRVEDITQRLNLARELDKQEAAAEEKLQFILQILQVEPKVLKEFIGRFQLGLAALDQLQSGSHDNLHEKIHDIFRIIHTLKGESALLRLSFHERPLHQLENVLSSLRANANLNASHLTALLPAMAPLQELDEKMRQALAQLDQLSHRDAVTSTKSTQPEQSSPLALAARLIEDLGERLAKPVAFHTTVRDDDLPTEYRKIIHELLLHLARNSMVHGIEPAPVRAAARKSASGTIQFAIKPHPDFHEIIFQDDGAGLNYERIRRRAAQLGHTLSTRDDLHQAIFAPGFSTAEDVSDLAGRGVGLDAIRHSVQLAGGSIHVYSEEGAYCAFQVLLPKAAFSTRRTP